MNVHAFDTIAAVATPSGEGAIAVIRMSGPHAIAIADKVFRGRRPLSEAESHTVHHGVIVTPRGEEVDEGLATVFRSPRSYTGEEVVEISCHGGILVTGAVLESLLEAGARQADPGEFTRRAFLNGKMDLSRAEAVAGLITSASDRARRASLEQLRGKLATAVEEIRSALTGLCALLEIDLDFSEEGIALIARGDIERKIIESRERLERMAETFTTGKLYRDGVAVVIAGRPNVGKSSLFNALLKESRAIVTPIPGTTRDFLEESVSIDGVLFRLTDTAGLRTPNDPVEEEGIARSRKSIERADIILLVDDIASAAVSPDELVADIELNPHQHFVSILNKIDLQIVASPAMDQTRIRGKSVPVVRLSARTGDGVHLLSQTLVRLVSQSGISSHEPVLITNRRHWESLNRSAESLRIALESISAGRTNEFVSFDVREAVSFLAEITGEVTNEDVLNAIFSEFCVGK